MVCQAVGIRLRCVVCLHSTQRHNCSRGSTSTHPRLHPSLSQRKAHPLPQQQTSLRAHQTQGPQISILAPAWTPQSLVVAEPASTREILPSQKGAVAVVALRRRCARSWRRGNLEDHECSLSTRWRTMSSRARLVNNGDVEAPIEFMAVDLTPALVGAGIQRLSQSHGQ
jgi:hypothetical protein